MKSKILFSIIQTRCDLLLFFETLFECKSNNMLGLRYKFYNVKISFHILIMYIYTWFI